MGSNYLLSIFWLTCVLVSSLGYLLAYHMSPSLAPLCFGAALIFSLFGALKALLWVAENFSNFWKRPMQWAHAIVFEVFAIGLGVFLRPFVFFSQRHSSQMLKTGRPVLLVHGYLHNASAWFFIQRALVSFGTGPIYTLNLSRPFASIREHAKSVATKADLISKETGRDDLVIVGHSMGGLVGACYALNIAPPEKKIEVVTIGTPLRGTRMAAFAFGSSGREMRHGSDFITDLFKEIVLSPMRFYHIASTVDQVVVPWGSALSWIDSEREFLVEDLGHMTLLFSPRVANKITSWIASEPK